MTIECVGRRSNRRTAGKPLSREGRVVRRLADRIQRVGGPALSVALAANRRQPSVILVAIPFERQAELQQGSRQQIPMLDEQVDQPPPDTAVAVRVSFL